MQHPADMAGSESAFALPRSPTAVEGERPRGRYAPSPTGLVHLGNARTALVAWLSIRAQQGSMVWRLEDLDGPRVVPGMAEAALEDLHWLGLDWDEGHDGSGPYAPYAQSLRSVYYEEALVLLHRQDRIFPCGLSRKDLRGLASAPHLSDGPATPYPPSLRPRRLSVDWFDRLRAERHPKKAIRFRVGDEEVRFVDRLFGNVRARVDLEVGDFVLKRRDGMYAYQLAVVVDDCLMRITEVVRGSDLLTSTARQIQLFEALGARVPTFGHVPLLLNDRGEKLSKRDDALTLDHLRATGVSPEQVVGYLGWSLGLMPDPQACGPDDLLDLFSWDRMRRTDWTLPSDVVQQIGAVT